MAKQTQESRKRSALTSCPRTLRGSVLRTSGTPKKVVAGALLSGGVAVAGIGLGAGTAQAVCSIYPQQPQCAPPEGPAACYDSGICGQEWCPNMGPMRRMPNWDMTVCHTYYLAPNSGAPALIVQGQPPGAPLPSSGPCGFPFMCSGIS